MYKHGRLNNRGDTIVEVLIAIAVVSAVLGGAFAASRRSLLGARTSQERGEAVKFVEGQLESLKSALDDRSRASTIFALAGSFCLDDSLDVVTDINNAACRKGPDGRYRLAVTSVAIPDTTGKEFRASATWDKIGGGPQERVEIVYKAYTQND
jgi:type II secretory pathway pseudopilin PulG